MVYYAALYILRYILFLQSRDAPVPAETRTHGHRHGIPVAAGTGFVGPMSIQTHTGLANGFRINTSPKQSKRRLTSVCRCKGIAVPIEQRNIDDEGDPHRHGRKRPPLLALASNRVGKKKNHRLVAICEGWVSWA
jgi:hypothetical protein